MPARGRLRVFCYFSIAPQSQHSPHTAVPGTGEESGLQLPLLGRCSSTDVFPLTVGARSRHFGFSTLIWLWTGGKTNLEYLSSGKSTCPSGLLLFALSSALIFLKIFFFSPTSPRFHYFRNFWQNPWFWGGGKTCKCPTPYRLKSASSATAGGCCTSATRHRAAGPHLGKSGSFLWKWERCQVWSKM